MRTVLGVALGATAMRAVAVRGGVVRWALDVACAADDDLSGVLAELLRRAPLRRWPRPTVVVAVDAGRSQVKRLVGLPPVPDPQALAALVREGVSRFFLKNGTPLVTSGVRFVEPGIAWAAAVDAPLVVQLERACTEAGAILRAVVPTAIVLPAALQLSGETLQWRDGEMELHLTVRDGHLTAVRRVPASTLHADGHGADHAGTTGSAGAAVSENSVPRSGVVGGQLVKGLAALGADAGRFADAYGASELLPSEPLAIRPGRDGMMAQAAPRWRRTIAACACIVSVTAALLAPGIAATRASRVARAALTAMSARRTAATATERDLDRASRALEQVSTFADTRTSATFLLRTLTAALPHGSALVTLRVDSTSATLVVLTPRAGAVVNALDHTAGITTPAIIGPVTRETVGTAELERVTIRFRIDTTMQHAAPAPSRAPRNGVSRDSATDPRTTGAHP